MGEPVKINGETATWQYYWEKYGLKGGRSYTPGTFYTPYAAMVRLYLAYVEGKMEKEDEEDFGERFFVIERFERILICEKLRKL